MDELFMLAGELLEDDKYKKDDVYDNIPDGEYDVVLEGITLKKSAEKGTEWFSIRVKVLNGDYVNRKEFINLFLTEKTVKRTLSTIMKLIDALGYEVDISVFEDKNTIINAISEMIGETVIYVKTTSKNDFVTHSFKKGE